MSDPSGYMPTWLKNIVKGALHNIAEFMRENDFSLIVGILSFIFAPGLVGFASKIFGMLGRTKKFTTTGHMAIMSIVSKGPAKRAFDAFAKYLRGLATRITFAAIPTGVSMVLNPERWWDTTIIGKAIDYAITKAEKWISSEIDKW